MSRLYISEHTCLGKPSLLRVASLFSGWTDCLLCYAILVCKIFICINIFEIIVQLECGILVHWVQLITMALKALDSHILVTYLRTHVNVSPRFRSVITSSDDTSAVYVQHIVAKWCLTHQRQLLPSREDVRPQSETYILLIDIHICFSWRYHHVWGFTCFYSQFEHPSLSLDSTPFREAAVK